MAGEIIPKGVSLSKVSPAFLHANSTSHTWAFSAFAELIDNAYDPDVRASELLIDKMDVNGCTCLIFLDNGAGMDTDHLLKMLSFGYCEKDIYEKTHHSPIGQFGNGFKSGSMRLAKDALVFTRHKKTASIGFLSQSYLKAIGADSVYIPIITYRLPNLDRIKSEQSRNNLNAILKYSVFKTEQDLKEELYSLEGSKTGTKIILSNLTRLQSCRLELDFSSEEHDIRCPESHEEDLTSVYHRPIHFVTSEYKHSLREYCSILFLRPRMKITIRGKRVKSKLISKSLSNTEFDSYKPSWLQIPLKITFGFNVEKRNTDDYGMMLYHRNRLIKAFEKVGVQKQPNDLGIGVVGVAQVNFLQPTHNKQDFIKDEKFNSVIAAFALKLREFWDEKKQNTETPNMVGRVAAPDWTWAQCDQCLKWRRMPDGIDTKQLPDQWYCRFNPDPTHNRCEIPEEPEDEDLAVKPSYVKTFKRKKEEMKRQEKFNQIKNMERAMIAQRDQGFQEGQQHMAQALTPKGMISPPMMNNGAMNDLHRSLAESQRREEEQRKFLCQLAEDLQHSKGKKENVLQSLNEFIGSISPGQTPNHGPLKRKMPNGPVETPTRGKRFMSDERLNGNQVNGRQRPAHGPSPSTNTQTPGGKAAQSTSPLKVKLGGLINSRENRAAPPPKPSSSSSSAAPGKSKRNKVAHKDAEFVDLTDDLDYKITINEDYDSDDVKPDPKQLQLESGRGKGSSSQKEKDMKPDERALDKKTDNAKAKEKETVTASTSSVVDLNRVKKENIDTAGTSVSSSTRSKQRPPSQKDVSDPSPPTQKSSTGGGNDTEMTRTPEKTISSNVEKVIAAIENRMKVSDSLKIKEKASKTGERQESDNLLEKAGEPQGKSTGESQISEDDVQDKRSNKTSSGVGPSATSKDMDDDVVEIFSDDDDEFTLEDSVLIKKEVAEAGEEVEKQEKSGQLTPQRDDMNKKHAEDVSEKEGEGSVSKTKGDRDGPDSPSNQEGIMAVEEDDEDAMDYEEDCDYEPNVPEEENTWKANEAVSESARDEGLNDGNREKDSNRSVGNDVDQVQSVKETDMGLDSERSEDNIIEKETAMEEGSSCETAEGEPIENGSGLQDNTTSFSKGDVDSGDSVCCDINRNLDEQKNSKAGLEVEVSKEPVENSEAGISFSDNTLPSHADGGNSEKRSEDSESDASAKDKEGSAECEETEDKNPSNRETALVKNSSEDNGNVNTLKGSWKDKETEVDDDSNDSRSNSPNMLLLPCDSDGAGEVTANSPVMNRFASPTADSSHQEAQTDLSLLDCGEMEKEEIMKQEVMQNLQTKLQVKTQVLKAIEKRHKNFLVSVHHLLGFLSPGSSLGEVEDIEQTVETMIDVYKAGGFSQDSAESQPS